MGRKTEGKVPVDFLVSIVGERALSFESRLEKARASKNDKQSEIIRKKMVSLELGETIKELFLSSFHNYPDHWISTKTLNALFPSVEEKRLRGNIQRVKQELLAEYHMALSNRPRLGYRLGVVADIPVEAIKSILRSISNQVSAIKTIEYTKPEHWKFHSPEIILIKQCRETMIAILPSLRVFEEKVRHSPIYKEISTQIQTIEETLGYYADRQVESKEENESDQENY